MTVDELRKELDAFAGNAEVKIVTDSDSIMDDDIQIAVAEDADTKGCVLQLSVPMVS